MNKTLIMPCGDNCAYCPRHTAETNEELQKAADLYNKLGWKNWKNEKYSSEEIKCLGCISHIYCGFGLKECLKERNLQKCNECSEFPCEKIDKMLQKSNELEKVCKEICTEEEFMNLKKAFFEKEENLKIM